MRVRYFKYIPVILLILWGISSCNKAEEEDIVLYSNAGQSFIDVETEGYTVQMGAEAVPEGQTGQWIIYKGVGGSFDNPNTPNANFFGEPGEFYHLGWEVSLGEQYKAATTEVSFKPLKPVVLNEMKDTLFNNVSLWLEAEEHQYGAEGLWTIEYGKDGRIENPESAKVAFIGKEGEEYTVRWTLSYGSKEEYLEYTFNTDTLRANGGGDNLDVVTSGEGENYFNLKADLPAASVGEWSLLEGNTGEVLISDDPYSLFKGLADSSYTLAWNVQVDDYISTDTIQIRFRGKWGTWTDERDGQSYRYVVLNGLEWMADNFNFQIQGNNEWSRSWYYGQTPRAKVYDGHPVETEEDRKYYGRSYNYYAAEEATPEGWRLPTVEEWQDLIPYLGGSLYAKDRMEEGGDSGLEIVYAGTVSYANGSTETYDHCLWQGFGGAYATSRYNELRFETSTVIIDKNFDALAFKPSPAFFQGMSVRYVRDIQK